MKLTGPPTRRRRRRRLPLTLFLILLLLVSAASLALLLLLRISGDASGDAAEKPIDRAEPRLTRRYDLSAAPKVAEEEEGEDDDGGGGAGEEAEEEVKEEEEGGGGRRSCATVEEMGEAFAGGSEKESLRIRELIRRHFDLHGALNYDTNQYARNESIVVLVQFLIGLMLSYSMQERSTGD